MSRLLWLGLSAFMVGHFVYTEDPSLGSSVAERKLDQNLGRL